MAGGFGQGPFGHGPFGHGAVTPPTTFPAAGKQGITLTRLHRTLSAIRMVRESGTNCWIVLGGVNAWPDDTMPPRPLLSTAAVSSPIGAVKATIDVVVRDAQNGTIVIVDPVQRTSKWRVVTETEAINILARHCLIRSAVEDTPFLLDEVRQVGVYTGLAPAPGYGSSLALAPEHIASYGRLELLRYRKPMRFTDNFRFVVTTILEF